MGCRSGKVTPVGSSHSDVAKQETEAPQASRHNAETEEADGAGASSNPRVPKMFKLPTTHPPPKHRHSAPTIDPFTNNSEGLDIMNRHRTTDGLDTLAPGPLLRSASSNTTTPLHTAATVNGSTPAAKFQPSAALPLMTGNLRNQREASNSQIDFFKMLDKKIEEGPELKKDDKIT